VLALTIGPPFRRWLRHSGAFATADRCKLMPSRFTGDDEADMEIKCHRFVVSPKYVEW